ncbi:indole-3-glycerol-phosphate synthase TrpC [Campylobacter peloridis]|uniref:indole-3-glycerol-phosphate synthase TrpC n=1 Tax=Campylobacter peloridis TaxID=488546 RepID=UPI001C73B9FF|nr:indole-3-glycerol-phosphate synthase TrpC [Campylobacter peloridis]MBX2078402.1 indole-3-glycerol-phosphate synthase TrpC [Campylobacter peloridis]
MFEKINLEQYFLKTQKILEEKKALFSYDMLGRSLASNAFYPKDIYKLLLEQKLPILFYAKNLDFNKKDFDGIILPTSPLEKQDIQNLSFFRRYHEKPLIQFDFIFDEYQILESLVYGADAFIIFPKMLKILQLKKLYNFAIHLGLEAIFYVESKKDINNAILAGARIFLIEDEKLLPLIPKNKALISKSIQNLHSYVKE